MLLKRQEKDGLIKALYDSSNVLASTYNKLNNNLTIIFNYGGQYSYSSVSGADYLRLESAESQGEVLNKYIMKYTATKLENVDTAEIIAEATKLKTAEDQALFEGLKARLIDSLNNMLEVLESEGEFSKDDFNDTSADLTKDVEKFKKAI